MRPAITTDPQIQIVPLKSRVVPGRELDRRVEYLFSSSLVTQKPPGTARKWRHQKPFEDVTRVCVTEGNLEQALEFIPQRCWIDGFLRIVDRGEYHRKLLASAYKEIQCK